MKVCEVRYLEAGKCRVKHSASGAELQTDTPPEYGGTGKSFSSTDLVAVALGTCIATSIDKVAERHGLDLQRLRVTVGKELSMSPKRIASLRVCIWSEIPVAVELQEILLRAAAICPVKRSLHPDVDVEISIECGSDINR